MRATILLLLTALVFACTEDPQEVEPLRRIHLPQNLGLLNEPADNPTTEQGVQLGRMLFYENRISRNDDISCASCHIQQFAFSTNTQFVTGTSNFKSKFNSPTLANLVYNNHFSWAGKSESLEMHALSPIVSIREMDQRLTILPGKLRAIQGYPERFESAFGTSDISNKLIAKALAQFQRTLISENSKFDQYLKNEVALTSQEQLGMELFYTNPITLGERGGACFECHQTNLFTAPAHAFDEFMNNGIDEDGTSMGLFETTEKMEDHGKFKVPTLRNVLVSGPYMHNGRYKSLENVIDHYSHGLKESKTLHPILNEVVEFGGFRFTEMEKQALVAFLGTLTDSAFLTNPKFSNPFEVGID